MKIVLNSINLSCTPTDSQTVTVEYREYGDTTFVLVTDAAVLLADGSFDSPVEITGLLNDTCYDIRITTTCGELVETVCIGAATTSTTSTTTAAPDQLYYWGWKSNNAILTQAQIIGSPNFSTFVSGSDLTAFFAGGVATPQFLWMAEPSTEPLKTKWQDIIQPFNGGNIGTDQDLFDAPVISGAFRFYISVYVTQQANPISFNVI